MEYKILNSSLLSIIITYNIYIYMNYIKFDILLLFDILIFTVFSSFIQFYKFYSVEIV